MLLLQALPYVCLLIAMLFFIYAIIGMQVSTDISACFLGHRQAGETHLSVTTLHSSQPVTASPLWVPWFPRAAELVQEPHHCVP